nr:hypothetical protein [Burkholderia seminalis]
MQPCEPLDTLGVDVARRLAQQLVQEQAAAHPDLAVDAPYRQLDPLRIERFLPREHVLIDAVDERAVEIEQKRRFNAHVNLLVR